MHKNKIPGVKGWHPNAQFLWGNTIPSYDTMNEQHPKGLPRGGEDDRPSKQDTVIQTRLVQRTLSGMNTTVLRISYLLKLLRETIRKSKVIQTSEEH